MPILNKHCGVKESMSKSVRRSERIQAMQQGDERKQESVVTPATVKDDSATTCSKISKRSLNSRREQIRIEVEMKKKDLLLKHQQEMMDLELALKLAKLEVGSEEEDEKLESIGSESIQGRPNIEKWVDGRCPWDRSDRHSLLSAKDSNKVKPESSRIIDNEIIASSQLTKILTRQSIPTDLPQFSGDPIEWPNFIFQYRNTTAICGFSSAENQIRLQKCLKGQARKIVESLLILPQNIDKVISILESRFGRKETIIMMLLDRIRNVAPVKTDKLDTLITFSDEIKNVVGTIESLNETDHLRNPILLQELLSKLPTGLKLNWIEHISNTTLHQGPNLLEFSSWLDHKASIACQVHNPVMTDNHAKYDNSKFRPKNERRDITLATNNLKTTEKRCICCRNELHHLSNCSKFKSLTNDDRWTLITKNKMCFSCLLPYHSLKQCKKIKKCGINNCVKPHHELLHKDANENSQDNVAYSQNNVTCSQNDITSKTEANYHISANKNVLLKILPVVLSRGDLCVNTYALLDDASTVTLIDQEIADQLELDGPQHTLSIQWTNNQVKRQEDSRIVTCNIKSPDNTGHFQLRHVRTIKGMCLPTQSVDMEEIRRKYPYISNKVHSMVNAKPRILIGQDNWPLLVNRKLISGPWNGPAMTKTLLGWVLHGNISTGVEITLGHGFVCHVSHGEKDDLDLLHDMVKQQWQMDNFGIEKAGTSTRAMSKEDKRAQNILDKTMRRKGERYETGLLWKDENMVLPESKSVAMRRLFSTERKMDRNLQFGKAYCEKMLDLEGKGYIRKLSKEEIDVSNPKTWYLPHFGVVNPNKPNKLRIVFDAAAKSNGLSLNDCLLSGPDLYNSLYNILLNFRIKKFAFTADIKEMFLQIQVRTEDRFAQRFLWRQMDRHRSPDVYEIGVVFFGSTSGPCLAQEAKNRNAREFKQEFPEAARAIIEDHYMDDYLGNADTEDEAKKLIEDVICIHKRGGFKICNWISNSETILEDIEVTLTAQGEKKLEQDSQSRVERILGVWWNPEEDLFGFHTKFHKIKREILENEIRPTKRQVLRVVMSIFDPLGFLANFIIQGKVLLQDIWRNKLDWDDEIPDKLNDKWILWITDLKNIFNFKISRQYFDIDKNTRDSSCIQLHIFTDASDKCYAAVAYLRIQNGNLVQTAFVSAKTRVAPLKPISIPRLELQAALMGARLGHSLKNNLRLSISTVFYWTDSKIVLHWIRSEAQRFHVFVAQRLGEIQELTNSVQWRHVASKENVADEATKRSKPLDFSSKSTWLFGPKFLLKDNNDWPKEERSNLDLIKNEENVLEVKNEFVLLNIVKENLDLPDPQRFSKWNRILRATAWTFRFIENCRGSRTEGELNIREIQRAEKLLYRKVQVDCFHEELILLEQNQSLTKSSKLYSFSCELDTDKLIRLGGRLNHSSIINEDVKKPIILEPKHEITRLIIQHYHEKAFHQGTETVINNLRQRFWILRIRQTVKGIIKSCQRCNNRKVLPATPIMGQLPLCRIEPTIRCFIKTGVDYFGPIKVAVKRSSEKRYGVIFTCMVTRAIHLEIAHDLTTNSFIHVLRQFGCRRGFPEEIYSDNGANFKSADKELSDAIKELNQTEISKFCTVRNVRWIFNPPLAAHMGGAWERLIQSVKKVMKELLISRCPQEYVLRTVFAEAENIINSRPLTHVSIDSNDSEALTPNHFLIGPSYASLPCTETGEKDLNLLTKWRASQKLADHFWRRWTQEYMPFLVRRSKWHKERKPIKVNDIVIIVDPNGPRNTWPKGRVTEVYPAKDGKIRIVDVTLANGIVLRRSVSRLCILDIENEKME